MVGRARRCSLCPTDRGSDNGRCSPPCRARTTFIVVRLVLSRVAHRARRRLLAIVTADCQYVHEALLTRGAPPLDAGRRRKHAVARGNESELAIAGGADAIELAVPIEDARHVDPCAHVVSGRHAARPEHCFGDFEHPARLRGHRGVTLRGSVSSRPTAAPC